MMRWRSSEAAGTPFLRRPVRVNYAGFTRGEPAHGPTDTDLSFFKQPLKQRTAGACSQLRPNTSLRRKRSVVVSQ
jgi:hypothetical protein